MGECEGCCWDKVGCRFQRHFSDRKEKPCKTHTEEEVAEAQREYSEYVMNRDKFIGFRRSNG